MRRFRSFRSLHRADDGAALVEAAVVIPFLVLLMVGVSGFGMVYKDLSTAQKSLRSAGRYLARLPASRLCSTAGQTEARNLAVFGNKEGTGIPVITNWSADATTGNIKITLTPACPGTPSTTPTDRKITMSASVPSNFLSWTTISLNPSHEERWIGQ